MDDNTEKFDQPPKRDAAVLLNKMERAYLSVLRAGALIIASLLLLYAAWLCVSGLYQVSRDVKSVKEAPAIVTTDEVTAVDLKSSGTNTDKETTDPFKRERAYYQQFSKRYFALYKAKFDPYRQADDEKISANDFNAQFVHLDDRLKSIKDGDLNFETDRADLESLFNGMTDVSTNRLTKDRLNSYKNSKKIQISRTITEMKPERYCSYYGYYIAQCITWETREVPVQRTITETKLPDGVATPENLFNAYHNKYISTLIEHRTTNAANAEKERAKIVEQNANGAESLWTAIRVIGSFVIVMFLFLLIALERHQRKIAQAQDLSFRP